VFSAAGLLRCAILLLHVENNALVGERGAIIADDVDAGLLRHLGALRPRLHRNDAAMHMPLDARRYRRDEPELVAAVIHDVTISGDTPIALRLKCRQQTQCQKAMRDGSAERTLLLAALDVDVNPLMIAGYIREFIDPFLTHLDRLAPWPILLAH